MIHKKKSMLYEFCWFPLVKFFYFVKSILAYTWKHTQLSHYVVVIFAMVIQSFMYVSTDFPIVFIAVLLLIGTIIVSLITSLIIDGLDMIKYSWDQIKDKYEEDVWRYEHGGADEYMHHEDLSRENEPDVVMFRLAGYLAATRGTLASTCVPLVEKYISIINENKKSLYFKAFYEGIKPNFVPEGQLSVFKQRTSDNVDFRLKLVDLLVMVSYADNDIKKKEYQFIKRVASELSVNRKELNEILSKRTDGHYGISYSSSEKTRNELYEENRIYSASMEFFTFTIMGYIAAADGKISDEEMDYFLSFIKELDLNEENEYIKYFYVGTSIRYNPKRDLTIFKDRFRKNVIKCRELLEKVIDMAFSDEDISAAEYKRLLNVVGYLDVPERTLQSMIYERTGGKFGKKPGESKLAGIIGTDENPVSSKEFYQDHTVRK